MTTQSKPILALILSAVLPGLGQVYNGERDKGLLILGSCLALGLFVYWVSGFNKLSAALAMLLIWLSAVIDAYKVAKSAGETAEFYYAKKYVVAMLLLVGPLALPLLWKSPNFSNSARWVWTVIVVGAALMFIATPYLLKPLIR
jgi:TM2 domain-containing membrane protein YozV